MPAPPCDLECPCGKHARRPIHNALIGIAVSLTAQSKIARGIPHMAREADHARTH